MAKPSTKVQNPTKEEAAITLLVSKPWVTTETMDNGTFAGLLLNDLPKPIPFINDTQKIIDSLKLLGLEPTISYDLPGKKTLSIDLQAPSEFNWHAIGAEQQPTLTAKAFSEIFSLAAQRRGGLVDGRGRNSGGGYGASV